MKPEHPAVSLLRGVLAFAVLENGSAQQVANASCTFWAASRSPLAAIRFKPDSSSIFCASGALVPSSRTITGR